MVGKIYLCGTIHTDQRGSVRLQEVLRIVRPTEITLELSPERFQHYLDHRAYVRGLGRAGLVDYARRQAEINNLVVNPDCFAAELRGNGFEAWVAWNYGNQEGIPVSPLGEERLFAIAEQQRQRTQGPKLSEYFKLKREDFQRAIDRMYEVASDSTTHDATVVGDVERDRAIMPKLLQREGTVLHIGGLAHMYGAHETLYDMLTEWQPVRFRLNDVDKKNFAAIIGR